jgi:uncharacterized protein
MKGLNLPFHIDVDGHVATTAAYAKIVEAQLVDVLMTNRNERVMRPDYGADMQRVLFDPTSDLVRSDAARQVMERIQTLAPRVTMHSVTFAQDANKPGTLYVDVLFRASAFDEVRSIRLPATPFLDAETPI